MADCVDLKAREDLAKLYTAHEQLATTVWGPDKTNGINSKVKVIIERQDATDNRIDELEEWGNKVWHIDRPANCIGKKAVEDLEARMAKEALAREKELVEMKKARLAMYTALGVALITTFGPMLQLLAK